jgi:hypothetical protein
VELVPTGPGTDALKRAPTTTCGQIAPGGALGRKFLRLEEFLKAKSAEGEEKGRNPKLFQ